MGFEVRNFATIRMTVQNVAVSRDWYRAFLKLEPVEDLENFVSFKIGSTRFDLSLADEKSPLSTGGSVGYWHVDDFENAIAHAKELGGKIYRGPLRVDEVRRTIVQIIDPQGNVFGLEAAFDAT